MFGCFLTTIIYQSVIPYVEEELGTSNTCTYHTNSTGTTTPIDNLCSWKPPNILSRYKVNKSDKKVQEYFFLHIKNQF